MRRARRAPALVAIVLALAMLLSTVGLAESASGWREGLSAAKPYEGVPEVDLSERMGYMMFGPVNGKSIENSCQRICVYLPRTDVKAGEGLLHVYAAGDEPEELWQTAMNEEASVTQRDMTQAELDILMWGSGTCFEIKLAKSLDLGGTYFVDLERGCIVTADGSVESPEVSGQKTWQFSVTGDYGVSGMEYRRAAQGEGTETEEEAVEETATPEPTDTPEPTATIDPRHTPDPATATMDPELEALIALANGITPEPTEAPELEYETVVAPKAGDEIHFDLVLGGEATQAIAYGYDSSVDFPVTTFSESGEILGQVLTENPHWGLMFLDAQGNELHRVEFR